MEDLDSSQGADCEVVKVRWLNVRPEVLVSTMLSTTLEHIYVVILAA